MIKKALIVFAAMYVSARSLAAILSVLPFDMLHHPESFVDANGQMIAPVVLTILVILAWGLVNSIIAGNVFGRCWECERRGVYR